MLITKGETKEQAQAYAEGLYSKYESLKTQAHYQKMVNDFKKLRLYGGALTLKQIEKEERSRQ